MRMLSFWEKSRAVDDMNSHGFWSVLLGAFLFPFFDFQTHKQDHKE
jgi:hypothetical protein